MNHNEKPRILVIGAHPDDCDIKCGGTAALWAGLGFTVRFVSATNGAIGHHEIGGLELVRRRTAEAEAAAQVIGIEAQLMDVMDGSLEPTLENRRAFIKLIREFQPDLIATHRPNDYHPDHRYTSQLVQDASYMVTVPGFVPTCPALRDYPVIVYLSDFFQKPIPFRPEIVVGIDAVVETKIDMMNCYDSQFYEWIPWNQRKEDQVPQDASERREWLKTQRLPDDEECANRYRETLKALYGEEGAGFRYAEAFEVCEYGGAMTPEKARLFFPFIPNAGLF